MINRILAGSLSEDFGFSRGSVLDTEESDSLGLESDIGISDILRVWLGKSGVALNRLPLELVFNHGLHVLVVAEGALNDLDGGWSDSIIDTLVKCDGVGLNIEGRVALGGSVEEIGDVLNSDKDLVLSFRELMELQVSLEFSELAIVSLDFLSITTSEN